MKLIKYIKEKVASAKNAGVNFVTKSDFAKKSGHTLKVWGMKTVRFAITCTAFAGVGIIAFKNTGGFTPLGSVFVSGVAAVVAGFVGYAGSTESLELDAAIDERAAFKAKLEKEAKAGVSAPKLRAEPKSSLGKKNVSEFTNKAAVSKDQVVNESPFNVFLKEKNGGPAQS